MLQEIRNINLNALWGQPNPIIIPQLIEQFVAIGPLLTQLFDSCKVSEPFARGRQDVASTPFQITAQFNSGTLTKVFLPGEDPAPIYSYRGDLKDYHINLINDVAAKFFYLINKHFVVNAETFDYIQRIPVSEWKKLAARLENTPPAEELPVEVFKKGRWKEISVFNNPEWPIWALKCYLEGKISRDQVGKLHLFDSLAAESRGYQLYQLRSPGSTVHDSASRKVIEQVLKTIVAGKALKIDNTIKERVFNALDALPEEETQFFSYKLSKGMPKSNFFDFRIGSDIYDVVFPPHILDVILGVIFGQQSMQIRPVLGYSLREHFADPNERDAMVVSTLVSTPKVLHGRITEDVMSFYVHDQDHLVLESSNPMRHIFVELAAKIESAGLTEASNIILDRAFFQFLKNFQNGSEYDKTQVLERTLVEVVNILNHELNSYEEKARAYQVLIDFVENRWPEHAQKVQEHVKKTLNHVGCAFM